MTTRRMGTRIDPDPRFGILNPGSGDKLVNVQISESSKIIIRSRVQSGRYASAEDVIEQALRLLEEREGALSFEAATSRAVERKDDLEIQRQLVEAGLLSEVRPPITDLAPYRNRRAVPIQGEPLSETVIRERR